MRNRIFAIGLGLAALLGASTSQSFAQAPAGGKQDTVQIALGALNLTVIAAELGKSKGFFAEQGINLEIQYLAGGAQAAQAVISKTVDYAMVTFDQVITSRVQGADLRAIVTFTDLPGQTLVIPTQFANDIKKPTDLHGKLLGVTGLGSGTHQTFGYILAKAGLDPKKESFIAVGGATLPAAVENGRVQAAMAADPYTTILLKSGKAVALFDMRTREETKKVYGSTFLTVALLTRPDVISGKADVTQRLVNAFVKINKWLAQAPVDEIAQFLPRQMQENKEVMIDALKASKEMYSADSMIRLESIQPVIETHKLFGTIKEGQALDPATLYDNRFVEAANKAK